MNSIVELDFQYIYNNLTYEEKEKFEDAQILLTGCSGFLGYYILNFLSVYADRLKIKKITGLDNFKIGRPKWSYEAENKVCSIYDWDITKGVPDYLANEEIDYVFHMASIASPTFYRKYPVETVDANIWGLRGLLEHFKNKSLKGMVFFSSSEIYGDPFPQFIPTDESYSGNVSCLGPRACYDESKRFGETLCFIFNEQYRLPIIIVRPFNNYGPGLRLTDKRVPADFALAIIQNEDIIIHSSGSPTRTFCYVADAVTGYLKSLVYGKFDYFNIGIDKPEISVAELADIYRTHGKKIFNYSGKVVYKQSEEKNYLVNNPNRRCPNIEKARKLLSYNPKIDVYEGVRRFLAFNKENQGAEL